jgi:hypothetical protein
MCVDMLAEINAQCAAPKAAAAEPAPAAPLPAPRAPSRAPAAHPIRPPAPNQPFGRATPRPHPPPLQKPPSAVPPTHAHFVTVTQRDNKA